MTFKNNANPSKWRSGWPPFTGWWNTKMLQNQRYDQWRWVDVEKHTISLASLPSSHLDYILWVSETIATYSIEDYRWSDYWPENARVDRVAPKGLK